MSTIIVANSFQYKYVSHNILGEENVTEIGKTEKGIALRTAEIEKRLNIESKCSLSKVFFLFLDIQENVAGKL